jgi:hypothetical protein
MRKVTALLLAFVLAISAATGFAYTSTSAQSGSTVMVLQIGSKTMMVNGRATLLDAPPIILEGRTLLPIRAVIEALGGTVAWDAATQQVTLTLQSTTVVLWIGQQAAHVNGELRAIDPNNSLVVPRIISSRTMLPIRFVAESLGCTVEWSASTGAVTVVYRPEVPEVKDLSMKISATVGGTVRLSDGASITVPPKALDTSSSVRVAVSTRPPDDKSGLSLDGDVYEFDLGSAALVKPVTITLPTRRADGRSLTIVRWNGTRWEALGGTVSDDTISVEVSDCSLYAVTSQSEAEAKIVPTYYLIVADDVSYVVSDEYDSSAVWRYTHYDAISEAYNNATLLDTVNTVVKFLATANPVGLIAAFVTEAFSQIIDRVLFGEALRDMEGLALSVFTCTGPGGSLSGNLGNLHFHSWEDWKDWYLNAYMGQFGGTTEVYYSNRLHAKNLLVSSLGPFARLKLDSRVGQYVVVNASPAFFLLREKWAPQAGDEFEADDSPTGVKTSIGVNGTRQQHSIDPLLDVDFVRFEAVRGYRYTVETSDTRGGCDTDLYVYDGNMTLIDSHVGVTRTSRVVFDCSKTGTCFAKITEGGNMWFLNSGPGVQYTIQVTEETVSLPDVFIDSLSWSPPSPKEGDSVAFTANVRNIGQADVASFNTKLYVAGNVIDTKSTSSLAAGSSTAIAFTGKWTATSGCIDIKVVVDADNAVQEAKEDNNELVKQLCPTPKAPDVSIWVDRGCGSTYKLGETIRVYGKSSVATQAMYVVQRPDTSSTLARTLEADKETLLAEGTLDGPTGQRTYLLRVTANGQTVEKSCSINVTSSTVLAVDISVDKGCGATYCVGDAIAIRFTANADGTGTILDRTPDGLTRTDRTVEMIAGRTYEIAATISPPTGTEMVTLQFSASDGRTALDSCSFVVKDCSVGEPSMTVLYPNGGETFSVGATMNISWTATGLSGGNISISYSYDGHNWSKIAVLDSAARSHQWIVPDSPSANCSVFVGYSHPGDEQWSVSDRSDSSFAIQSSGAPGGPTILVTSPNGGENWKIGSQQTVTWTASGLTSGDLGIEYWDGLNWSTVVTRLALSARSYTWTVPNAPTSLCHLMVRNGSDGQWTVDDISDQHLTISIEGSSLELTSPGGGENWKIGSQQTIAWTASGLTNGYFEIMYWDGAKWSTLVTGLGLSTRSYTWIVPGPASNNSYVTVGNAYNGRWILNRMSNSFSVVP